MFVNIPTPSPRVRDFPLPIIQRNVLMEERLSLCVEYAEATPYLTRPSPAYSAVFLNCGVQHPCRSGCVHLVGRLTLDHLVDMEGVLYCGRSFVRISVACFVSTN